ncbi:MAG: hypothetical protein ACREFQ_21570, partial [Stellaceae bacterium]
PGAIMEPLIGDKKLAHDPRKFNYLGSANNEVDVCIARADAPAKTFKDVFTTPMRIAASAAGGSTRDFPAALDNILGAKFKLVLGYPGSREMMLAIEQGEVAGACGIGVSSIEESEPTWIPSHKVIVLAQEALKPAPEMAPYHVPLVMRFATTDEQRQLLELMYAQLQFGRPFVVPPGTPKDRLEVLRKTFIETLRDPATLADAKKVRLPIDPTPGGEVQALVTKVYATPPAIVAKLKRAITTPPK